MTEESAAVRVDAHHHLWDPSQRDYPFLHHDQLEPIRRRFTADDFGAAARVEAVTQSIVVQAVGSLEETRQLLAVAEADPLVAGVVGWVDLTAPDVTGALASLRLGPGGERLVGVRHQVHDEADPAWLLRDDVQRGLAAVADAGLAYDLLVRTRELTAATVAVGRWPGLQFVVDHGAKPEIAAGGWEPWASRLAELAGHGHVACKLSGLVTEADWSTWTADQLRPYVGHIRSCFGADRVLFGSDWPVCLLAGTYRQVVDALEAAAGPMSSDEWAQLWGANARRVYRLPVPA